MYQQYQQPGYPAQQPQAQPQQQYGVQYPGKQLCTAAPAVPDPVSFSSWPWGAGQGAELPRCPCSLWELAQFRNCQEENTVAVSVVST